ncbi:hypothetical protein AB4Y42_40805 [Paraburkholderia sp. EG286B]|uniref:hypothetical protein n=1 Tax=Paraburkholderia sp. EG286B TaxID=3237011 RepID=UPI0034D17F4D
MTVFLGRREDYKAVNRIYAAHFGEIPRPHDRNPAYTAEPRLPAGKSIARQWSNSQQDRRAWASRQWRH